MEFWIIIGLGVLGLSFVSMVLPWIQRGKIEFLTDEVKRLGSQVAWLTNLIKERGIDVVKPQETNIPPEPQAIKTPALEEEKIESPIFVKTEEFIETPKKPKINFEQQFGARLPVWVGGIALALAGLFMVKYSIETGLLSPTVRLVLGGMFGIVLLYAGNWVFGKNNISNGTRIAQALSGAGLADLFACLFAATSLYHLIPVFAGFAGMAAVTALAVTLSLRHGPPIALLGLVGGFLTPALVGSSEPNAPLLFVYLYFVLAGLFTVIRKQNWWLLSIPTVVGAFLWIIIWLANSYRPADGIWLGLFLLAVSATIAITSKKAMEDGKLDSELLDSLKLSSALNYLAMGGAVVLMGFVAAESDFGLIEWGLFGLLTMGGIALAYFNQKLYEFVPWLSMAVNMVMLATWHGGDNFTLALILLSFALLYMASSYFIMWKAPGPVSWAALAGVSSLGYYLLGYYELHGWLAVQLASSENWLAAMPLWGMLAFILSSLAISVVKQIMERFNDDGETKQKLLAIFAIAATAFLSIGLTIELKHEFLSVVFAAEMLAISWISTRINIKALRYIVGLLGIAFTILLIPQALLLVQLTAYSLVEAKLYLQEGVPIVNWPLFQLGLPALMFIGSTIFLRKEKDDRLINALEISAIALLGVMGYYLTRNAFHIGENVLFSKAGFTERGVITNILFIYGLSCFWVGRIFARRSVSLSGLALSAIALFRIGYFDLFIHNPIWSHQLVGSLPILNALLLPYGLPIAWLILANKELPGIGKGSYLRYTNPLTLLLAFMLLSLNVRQIYHSEYLDSGITSNAEIYTYSAVWLIMGIALLFFGTLRQDKTLRIASLAIMILTVGKVFLYDASELTGLFRVFSFLGLGLSLLALSWFYTRFVFKQK